MLKRESMRNKNIFISGIISLRKGENKNAI